MKLIITGYAQHGKDTVCDFLHSIYRMPSISSSLYAVQHTPAFDDLSVKTKLSKKELYIHRDKYRKEFFDIIANYNKVNGMSTLGRGIFAQFDIYNGIRNDVEFFALREESLYHKAIWVDASKRKPPEAPGSCTMRPEYCDVILDNNGDIEQLVLNIITLIRNIRGE